VEQETVRSFSILTAKPASADWGLLLLRVWFGSALAFTHGWSKVSDLDRFVGSVGQQGIPLPQLTAPLAAASEFIGGLLLALGLFTRSAGLSVLATMLVAAFHVHANDPFRKQEFALAYGVTALALAVSGPGRFSIDGWWRQRRQSTPASSPR
jgi:putative oxidoreductase